MIVANTWRKDAFGRTVHTKQYIKIPDPDWRVMTGYYIGYELWRARVHWNINRQ
jgi:hypothetical protein